VTRLVVLLTAAVGLVLAPVGSAQEPTPPATPPTIPAGVWIGNVQVGGLTAEAATLQVQAAFALPVVLTYGSFVFEASPSALAVPAIQQAVGQALVAQPDAVVPLAVTVRTAAVKAFIADLAKRFARPPVDARLFLRKLKPWIAPEKPGRQIHRAAGERDLTRALLTNARSPVALRPTTIAPKLTRKSFGPVIVIKRGSNVLSLYYGMRHVRTFRVATGERRYPTPLGRFRVIVKAKNPWWYPPDSDWAKDKEPVPPGPSNPLGTRWMGISSPGVGIHGTPNPGSIGYSVSHGCVRMRVPEAEWLFERVRVGTTVFIVSA
jgi:lipoprotein-anchoring transpeptidase ErfK/SrfK